MDLKKFNVHKGKNHTCTRTQNFLMIFTCYFLIRQLSSLKVVGLAEQLISSAGPLNEIRNAKLGKYIC
jgi:hypothetical protein